MEKKYYFKISSKVDFLWILGKSSDPFRENERLAEFFVNNIKFETRTEGLGVGISQNFYKEIESFQEIQMNENFENKVILNDKIGLLRIIKDGALFATRYLPCFNKIVSIGIFSNINDEAIRKYLYLINATKELGDLIYQKSYEYYQISGSDEYFNLPEKLTIEEFKTTIELQEVYFEKGNDITIYFRPSWDEEHGLCLNLNSKTGEVEVTI
jgi:hypothetical protein